MLSLFSCFTNFVLDCCAAKFNVSKKVIEHYVARNIANMRNYQGKKYKSIERFDHFIAPSSSQMLPPMEPQIKSEVFFEVMELN